MNAINVFSKKDIVIHATIWTLIGVFLSLVDPLFGSLKAKLFGNLLLMINYIGAYYFLNLFIFRKFLGNRYMLLTIWISISYILFAVIFFLIIKFILPYLGGKNITQNTDRIVVNSLLLYSFIFFSSLGNYLNRLGTQKLKMQYENEKILINKELNFLKNQFNSHITFNFLNFCYSHVHQSSAKAAEAIELFSDMLRYTLKIKPDENLPLRKEIAYIANFINLQKCLSNKVFVNLTCEGCINEKLILPRILITFVENAFKHGKINDDKKPIDIYLLAKPDSVFFSIRNQKSNQLKNTTSGIGQQNVKQMLDFFYKQNYQLNIQQDALNYFCTLTLTL